MLPDVIVVGAGIVGAAVAESLAVAGCQVEVLESTWPGNGTTGAAMGHLVILDDSEAQFALTRLSLQLWDARAEQWGAALEWEACGTLWVAADAAELDLARHRGAWFAERGVSCELLDPVSLRDAEPHLAEGLAGGLRVPGDRVIYPPTAVRLLLQEATRRGATISSGTPVRRAGDGWVELADGTRRNAGVVIAAAGLATVTLLAHPPEGLVLIPKKGHLAITDRYPGWLRHQLIELSYLKSAHGSAPSSVAFNVQPRATGQILIGSSRQAGTLDPAVEPTVLSRMLARAVSYLPRLEALTILRTWVGFRPATPDNLPLIGPVPGQPRLWLATGHEGIGVATALATASLIRASVLGKTPPLDPAPYAVDRVIGWVAHA
jgi:glycine/D-amino acid oxidase-like deaminating enzyme